MSERLRFDHAVILVADLEQAVADFTALGFTVTPGGEHTGGMTHNAVIAFADGSYLELLAYTRRMQLRLLPWVRRMGLLGWLARRRSGLMRRFLLRSAAGEGLIDFALLPSSLAADLARARGAGVEVEGPLPGGRVQPDGEVVEWELGIPRVSDLPFLCADVTPHERRVPEGAAREHANGVTGVAGIIVAVANLEASSARYRALLGLEPQSPTDTPLAGSRARAFVLDGAQVMLLAPTGVSPVLRRYLRQRGEAPFGLRLYHADQFPSHTLDPARTHGARLELVSRPR